MEQATFEPCMLLGAASLSGLWIGACPKLGILGDAHVVHKDCKVMDAAQTFSCQTEQDYPADDAQNLTHRVWVDRVVPTIRESDHFHGTTHSLKLSRVPETLGWQILAPRKSVTLARDVRSL